MIVMELKEKDKNIYNFLPVTLSIETKGGISTPVVRRGTPLPTKRSQVFSTASDNQKSVEINVLVGERPLTKNNISIGRCQLDGITLAPSSVPQIRVTFEVDTSCNVKVEASEIGADRRIETKFEKAQTILTDELVQKLLLDAQKNKPRDDAQLTIAEAESRVQSDQLKNEVTSTTKKIDELISNLGIALMDDNLAEIVTKTRELRNLLEPSRTVASPYDFSGFNIFESFSPRKSSVKQRKPNTKQPVSPPQDQKKEDLTPISTPLTHITTLIQNFLEQVAPDLEIKRSGAWQALESGTQDGPAQATHSMREVLRQLLDKIAPASEVQQAPWYKKPKDEPPVTRAMRIRYAITGMADIESESTLSLINGMAEAVNSMYAKLSAESHSEKRLKISTVRMYLNACESLIGLIATERRT
jgi:hypothetical protein